MQSESSLMYDDAIHVSSYDEHARQQGSDQWKHY